MRIVASTLPITSASPIWPWAERGQPATAIGGLRVDTLLRREIRSSRMQEAVFVEEPEAAAGFLFRETIFSHGRAQEIRDADARRSGPEHDDLLILQRLFRPPSRLPKSLPAPQPPSPECRR